MSSDLIEHVDPFTGRKRVASYHYEPKSFQDFLDAEYESEADEWIRNGMKTKKKEPQQSPSSACILTFTGKLFYPFKPSPKDVDVRDIAHGLSHLCRFAGQGLIFWSVAQHAMLAADISLVLSHSEPRIVQLLRTHAVLHHDDSEAYCIDLPKPIKNFIPAYESMEDEVTRAINEALHIDTFHKDFVKVCDNLAFDAESGVLFKKTALKSELGRDGTFARLARLSFQEVEKMFLDYSDLLSTEIHEEFHLKEMTL